MKIALIGASGFVGTRIVEQWNLTGAFEIVPIVRSYSSLAVLARFELPWQVCDLFDVPALARAMEGCDAVVHAAIGDPGQIEQMAQSIYEAAEIAHVRRLVVLSSASVHGQAPEPGTDETSPLHERHSMAYNSAKVRAEKALHRLSASGNVEVVLLRPSVVYGPRSRWIADTARQLLEGSACLIGDGNAICNGIYVDNLIAAIELALQVPQAAGETFLVGDPAPMTWRSFYQQIADALGIDMATVGSIPPPIFPRSFKSKITDFAAQPAIQKLLPFIPGRLKRLTKLVLANWNEPPAENAWQLPAPVRFTTTEELSLLQQCQWQLPQQKAQKILGYIPKISAEEGMQRSLQWLKFAGYPVIKPGGPPAFT
jgi:nucleoside-diphosphate-sugar epimerase